MWLSDTSIKRPVFITMVILALVVVGVISYSRMGVDLYPNISIPVVAVQTAYPGAGPGEVEAEVSRPLEEALGSLSGVDSISSTSSEGLSLVIVSYKLEYPPTRAIEDMRERVLATRGSLPREIEDPVILRFDPSATPIISFAVVEKDGSLGLAQLKTFVQDEIKPRMERLDGVAAAEVSGGLEREVQVQLSLDRLRALGISPQQVAAAIKTENLDVPGGRLSEGGREHLLRTPGKFQRVEDIGQAVVANRPGAPVLVQDVATVQDGFKEVRSYNRLNGKDNLFVSVRKQSGTNTVQVASEVRQEIGRIVRDYPTLDIVIAVDQSEFVQDVVQDSLWDLVLGALLASVVVFLFFRDLRNTIITVIGLPVIIVGAFWGISLFGFTLNMMTLVALALSIGLLIDDAIVVRENIFRHMEAGEEPRVAASRASAEIALAVLAMTLSVVSVFLPVAFTKGVVGQFFREFGITVAVAVLISLFEAFTLAPMLSAYFFRRVEKGRRAVSPWGRLSARMGWFFEWLNRTYRRLLAWALSHRALTLVMVVAIFFLSLALIPLVGQAFFAPLDTGWFGVGLKLPPGTALEQADQKVRAVEDFLLRQPEVEHVFATVGSAEGAEQSTLFVTLREHGRVEAIQQELRNSFGNVATLSFTSEQTVGGGGGVSSSAFFGRPIQVSLRGPSLDELDKASQQLMEAMADVPGLVDLDRSLEAGKPELRVQVDRRRAADLGLSTSQVGSTVRTLVQGEVSSQFREGDKDFDILVRLREEDRQRREDLLSLTVLSSRGTQVPLQAVASIETATGPTLIQRQDRQRQVLVGADFRGRPEGDVVSDIQARLKGINLPPGVSAKFVGQQEIREESFSTLYTALALSVVFMYMVLASQFGSFFQPLIIMLALPLSVIGAFLALLVTGTSFDITAMVGLILLMGIVTKNSILLVDFANMGRRQGVGLREAILNAGSIRLRPILMTTLALLLGMLPVALGLGAGGEWRQPMAIAVMGGLITSTMLTLVVVPVVYSLFGGLRRQRQEG